MASAIQWHPTTEKGHPRGEPLRTNCLNSVNDMVLKKHYRRSIRLRGYDYSQAGLYFITICTQHRLHQFGEIEDDEMVLNDAGKMIETQWLALSKRFKIQLHEYVIMPNHFHGIIEILNVGAIPCGCPMICGCPIPCDCQIPVKERAPTRGAPTNTAANTKTVGDIVGAFKSISTHEYIRGVKQNDWQRFDGKLWQRNYWEHIIRNENEGNNIAQYIIDNPAKWAMDKLNNGVGNQVMELSEQYNEASWMV